MGTKNIIRWKSIWWTLNMTFVEHEWDYFGYIFWNQCTNHFHLYFWLFITLKKELVMSKCMTNPNFCEKRFSSVDGIIPMFMHGKKIRKKLPLLFFKDLDHEKLDDIWHIQIKIYYHSVWKSPKISHIFILAFTPNFCPIKLTCLVTLFERKLQVFKTLKNWQFWHF